MTNFTEESGSDIEISLLNVAVDFCGRPVNRTGSGGWRSASFIIGVEVAERFAYYGIALNLMIYLTGPLGQTTVAAAENVNVWSGISTILPLLGAFLADSFLGPYRTIVISSIIYILVLLSLSATLPSFSITTDLTSTPAIHLQMVLFYVSLYLIAIAQGGHKPCVQAFGADQFDPDNPKECKAKSSFFNWWYFGMNGGILLSNLGLPYIMENLTWALGFGIPCIIMMASLVIFLLGTKTYRFNIDRDKRSPFLRIGGVFSAAASNWRSHSPTHGSQKLKFLNKALVAQADPMKLGTICTLEEVEEAKEVLGLGPIWASCLIYGIVFAQSSTFFSKQGSTMDRSTGFGVDIPAATLQSFIGIAVMLVMPIYDLIFIPLARGITGKPSGITMLQRIGTGMLISALSMVTAAIIEHKRLKVALENGLENDPNATIPMHVWWLVPQYVLYGVEDVFTMVGLQEFFYDQVPTELRSVGLSLFLSILGVGSFLSSILISLVEKLTSSTSECRWFSDNLNLSRLDYFYWLLAALSLFGLAIFVYCAKAYVYKRASVL